MNGRAALRGEAFGDPRLLVDGEPLVLRGAQRRRIVSLLLARSPEPVPVWDLADIVDPDATSPNPSNVVQAHIRRLRRDLEPGSAGRDSRWLHTLEGGYALVPDSLDLWEFRSAVSRAADMEDHNAADAATSLRNALALWVEPFGNLGDDEGLSGVTHELHALRRTAEDQWCKLAARLGANDLDADQILAYAMAEPLREARWETAMAALVGLGRQADALRAYETARRHLRDTLGVDPGVGLKRMHEKVLAQDPSLSSPDRVVQGCTPHGTSLQASAYTEETAKLTALVEHHRLVTVSGLPSVGKSSLVKRWLNEDHPYHDALWVVVPEQGHERSVTDALGEALDRDLAPRLRADHHALLSHLPRGEVLVVFDGAEQRIDEVADLVDALLRSHNDARFVATSTIPLGLPGEQVLHLDAHHGVPAVAEGSDGTPRPGPTVLTSASPIDRPTDTACVDLRVRAIERVIEHLSPSARQLLAVACVSPDGVSRQSSEWVCNAGEDHREDDPYEHSRCIGELVRAGLLLTAPAFSGSRYRPPDPVTQVVLAGLEARSVRSARAGNARWIAHLAGSGSPAERRDDPGCRDLLLDEWRNVVEAHRFLQQDSPTDLAAFVMALARRLDRTPRAHQVRKWIADLPEGDRVTA